MNLNRDWVIDWISGFCMVTFRFVEMLNKNRIPNFLINVSILYKIIVSSWERLIFLFYNIMYFNYYLVL
jgi:hypothetical protein